MRAAIGDAFVDYYVAIKRFEVARSAGEPGSATAVSGFEHREYFDLA
jgi:hypothetical protein